MKQFLTRLSCVAIMFAALGCAEKHVPATAESTPETTSTSTPAPSAPTAEKSAQEYVAHEGEPSETGDSQESTIGSTTPALQVKPPVSQESDGPPPLAFNPPVDVDGAPRVSVEDVQRLARNETVHLLDVRSAEAFNYEHAVFAINIPSNELGNRFQELPRDGIIVAMCT